MLTYVQDNAFMLLCLTAVVEAVIGVYFIHRLSVVKAHLQIAVEAAEDAARAAALAAPGGIDPEVVIDLIRQGKPATLDTIHDLMERQAP